MRKGYSIFQRGGKGPWYVSWPDGTGKRQTKMASLSKSIAAEIGRKNAMDADRVRGGLVKPEEVYAASSAKSQIEPHIKAWEKKLLDKKNTPQHAHQQFQRVKRIFELAGIRRLTDTTAEKIQAALAVIKTPQTARHYLTALRTFIRFCTKTHRLNMDPIAAVDMPQVAGETFQRHPFTDAEVAALIEAAKTRESSSKFSAIDRAMFYLVLAYTGLRKSEALSLTPQSFDLDKGKLVIEAAYSKHRRRDEIELRLDLVNVLRPFLAFKKSGSRIFGANKWTNFNNLFALDCKAAGIKAAKGERLGLHSLRRWFITSAIRSSDLAVAQRLARHGTPALTAKYADVGTADLKRGLSGMPQLKKKSG